MSETETAARKPRPSGKQPRILAIANQKGGVGKTTTTVNLGTALAAVGRQVLIIDLDPQSNATTGFGINPAAAAHTSYELVLGETTPAEAALDTRIPGLSIVSSTVDLSGAELELVGAERREYRLRGALSRNSGDPDYILIDCPPALGLLTLNALTAANAVLVPLQCEYYALEGLSHLIRTIDRVREAFNPGLGIQGVVLTMFDKRNNLSAMVAEDARSHLGDKVYRTVIPRNVRISEAPSHGAPVLLYDMNSAGAQAYIQLAGEVIRRERELEVAVAPGPRDADAAVAAGATGPASVEWDATPEADEIPETTPEARPEAGPEGLPEETVALGGPEEDEPPESLPEAPAATGGPEEDEPPESLPEETVAFADPREDESPESQPDDVIILGGPGEDDAPTAAPRSALAEAAIGAGPGADLDLDRAPDSAPGETVIPGGPELDWAAEPAPDAGVDAETDEPPAATPDSAPGEGSAGASEADPDETLETA